MIYPINHLPDKITVGVQTEQGVEDIGFDLRPWLAVFPDMVFTVWATRPGEKEAYPVNEQMLIGSVLYWHPDGFDTEMHGTGKVEVVGVGENQRKLSGYVETSVRATSMSATKEPGENTVPWYEKIINAAIEIMADVDVGAGGLFLVTATGTNKIDRTVEEIFAAADANKTIFFVDNLNHFVCPYIGKKDHPDGDVAGKVPAFSRGVEYNYGVGVEINTVYIKPDGTYSYYTTRTRTPNPYPITFTGAVEASYNGSKGVTVKIPTAPEDAENLYIVTVAPTSTGWASDRSRAEIDAAQAAGKACLMHFPVSGEVMLYRGNYKFASNVYSNNASAPGLYFDWAEVNADQTVDKYGGGPLTAYPGAVSSSKGTCYLRWNGTKWEEATIAQLKADLGLT